MRKQVQATKKPGQGMYVETDKQPRVTRPATPPPSKKKPA